MRMQWPWKNMPDCEDVTANMLTVSKISTVPLPGSFVRVHRGSLTAFLNLGASTQGISGLMLAKKAWNAKHHASQIVVGKESSQTMLEHPRVKSKCDTVSLTPCGAIVVGSPENWRADALEFLRQFPFTSPLLISVDYSDDRAVAAWELVEDTNDSKACSVSYTTHPRDQQRRLCYNICWLQELGTSHVEAATKKICEAVVSHVHECISANQVRARPKIQDIKIQEDSDCFRWQVWLACPSGKSGSV